mmetsp:Transcript_24252/g.33285  ORF Transcript_24252/g.33285 Transcript_24252/m.33285 type:complete len:195 (+) Transcript_24252:338-922(+)
MANSDSTWSSVDHSDPLVTSEFDVELSHKKIKYSINQESGELKAFFESSPGPANLFFPHIFSFDDTHQKTFSFKLGINPCVVIGAVGLGRETEETCLFRRGEIAIKSTTIGGAPDQLAKYPAVWEQMSSFELVLDLAKKTLDFTVDGKLINTMSYAHKSSEWGRGFRIGICGHKRTTLLMSTLGGTNIKPAKRA